MVAGAIAAEAAFRKAHGLAPLAPFPNEPPPPVMDAAVKDLMMEALNSAKLAGASYADVRIGRYLQNFVSTREQQITNVVDTDLNSVFTEVAELLSQGRGQINHFALPADDHAN